VTPDRQKETISELNIVGKNINKGISDGMLNKELDNKYKKFIEENIEINNPKDKLDFYIQCQIKNKRRKKNEKIRFKKPNDCGMPKWT